MNSDGWLGTGVAVSRELLGSSSLRAQRLGCPWHVQSGSIAQLELQPSPDVALESSQDSVPVMAPSPHELGGTHWPAEHWPEAHVMPHAPQLLGLV
jgi:hypothetical protein